MNYSALTNTPLFRNVSLEEIENIFGELNIRENRFKKGEILVLQDEPANRLIILLAGVFMETSSAIIILSPVFLPLVKAMGISTVHFGILFVVGIAIGMITPPVAINLFVASGITGLPIERISKSVIPYLIGLIIVFFMIVYVPLLIPGLM